MCVVFDVNERTFTIMSVLNQQESDDWKEAAFDFVSIHADKGDQQIPKPIPSYLKKVYALFLTPNHYQMRCVPGPPTSYPLVAT